MLKFKSHLKEQEHLDEGIRQWLSKAKSVISRAFKSGLKRIRKLKVGQSVKIPVSLPKNISEAKEKQLGKKGGELAEVAMIKKLYETLKSKGVEVYYWENGKSISAAKFKSDIYNKNLGEYLKQEGSNRRKRSADWIRHGEAGAQHVFTYLEELEGSWDLYRIKIEHLGEALTGISKGDINVVVEVKETDKVLDYIGHLSVKTTLDNSPLATPDNALQTSWDTFVLSLLTGKTARQLNLVSNNKVQNAITRAKKNFEKAKNGIELETQKFDIGMSPKKIAQAKANVEKFSANMETAISDLQTAESEYEKTLEYQLDELGKRLKLPQTSLSQYMEEIKSVFEKYNRAPGRAGGKNVESKDPEIVLENEKMVKEYMIIIKAAIENALRSSARREEMIKGILELGGVESGLDYLALGVDINDKQVSDAISTLGSKEFKELQKKLSGELKGKVEFTEGGRGLIFTIFSTKPRREILSFEIGKSVNNSRIYLPTFPADDGTRLSMLKKYATYYDKE